MKQKQKSKRIGPLLAAAAAFAIWGFNTPLIEKSLTSFPLFTLVFLKFLVSGIVFGFLASRHWKKVSPKLWPRIVLATIFGYFLNGVLFYKGVMLTGGLNASLLYLLAPLVLYFSSIRFLKERYDHKLLVSVLAGFAGTILIVGAPLLTGHEGTRGDVLGNILIILAVGTDVAGTILIKPVLKKVPTMQISAIRAVLGTFMMFPLILHEFPKLAHLQIGTVTGLTLGYNLVFSSIVAVYLYHWALARVSGEQISPLQYLDPTIGAIASMVLLAQRPAPTTIAGIVLVFGGLYLGGANTMKTGHHHATHHR